MLRQEHNATGDDCRTLGPRPEQHRIGSEERAVGQHDIGREFVQRLLHALVRSRDRIDEDMFDIVGHALGRGASSTWDNGRRAKRRRPSDDAMSGP
jgi:hypothetical protein